MNLPSPGEIAALVASFGSLWIALRKGRPEARKLAAEADLSYEELDQKRRDRIEELEESLEDAHGAAARLRRDLETAARRRAELEGRVARLEGALPMALIAHRLEDLSGLRLLLDAISDPLVATTAARGGSILWANRAFCSAVGRELSEVLALGWRGLIDPACLDTTQETEATAWTDSVAEFVNRYQRADGGRVWFRWLCPPYRDGVTLALARVVRVEPPPPTTAREEAAP